MDAWFIPDLLAQINMENAYNAKTLDVFIQNGGNINSIGFFRLQEAIFSSVNENIGSADIAH